MIKIILARLINIILNNCKENYLWLLYSKIMKPTLQIQNLKCGGCKKTIINKLKVLKNISNVTFHLENSFVLFKCVVNEDIDVVKKNTF